MKYFIAALSAVNPDTAGQYDITGLNFFPLGFMNADSSTSANDPMEPVAVQPFGAKGAGGSNGFMMPPNAILIAAPGINQNGSIVHQAISADL